LAPFETWKLDEHQVPKIPLLNDADEALCDIDSVNTLMAIWQFPNDLDSVLDYRALALESFNRARASGESFRFSHLTRETLIRGLDSSRPGGRTTAAVFLKLLQLKIHVPKKASVGMATFLVSRLLAGIREDGRQVPLHRDNIHKLWAKFRPAAHLWGASHYLLERGMSLSYDEGPFANRIFDTAQALLDVARSVKWNFDDDPWELPAGYHRQPIEIILPSPDDKTLELMTQYKAPIRPK
jgi:hypothetical protein